MDCGGIDESVVKGDIIDGIAPIRNAFRGHDTWNSLDILFRAPRYKGGRKVEDARILEVRLNGVPVQVDIAVASVSKNAPMAKEGPTGPLVLEGAEFRDVWSKPIKL